MMVWLAGSDAATTATAPAAEPCGGVEPRGYRLAEGCRRSLDSEMLDLLLARFLVGSRPVALS